VGLTINGDAAFLHDFEEGGLGFGRGAVDFVGEQELSEDGALTDADLLGGEVEEGVAGDVGGHQVGGELDAAEGAAEGSGEGEDEVGFAEAGFAFEEDVAAGEEGGEDLMDDFFLAKKNLGNSAVDGGQGGGLVFCSWCLIELK
jgi:hypothetical protein